MSFRELYREMEVARVRMKDESESLIRQAWHTANFMLLGWAGKMPDLEAVIGKIQTTAAPVARLQTKSQTAAMVRMLADRCGQPVRRTV